MNRWRSAVSDNRARAPIQRIRPNLLLLIGSMLLASCEGQPEPVQSPEPSMWYRFKFEATYQGQPVKFDQFIHCGRVTVPEGPLGARTYPTSPSLTSQIGSADLRARTVL